MRTGPRSSSGRTAGRRPTTGVGDPGEEPRAADLDPAGAACSSCAAEQAVLATEVRRLEVLRLGRGGRGQPVGDIGPICRLHAHCLQAAATPAVGQAIVAAAASRFLSGDPSDGAECLACRRVLGVQRSHWQALGRLGQTRLLRLADAGFALCTRHLADAWSTLHAVQVRAGAAVLASAQRRYALDAQALGERIAESSLSAGPGPDALGPALRAAVRDCLGAV